jgi:hypothetical protein
MIGEAVAKSPSLIDRVVCVGLTWIAHKRSLRVLISMLVQVGTNEEKTDEKKTDNIPPKTFGIFGAGNNTVVAR